MPSLLRKTVVTLALTLAALAASVLPASASAPPTVTVDRVCSGWSQVIPNVWAIICLDRSGALFQPYAEMQNLSSSPVTMDVFVYLNTLLHNQCGTWPSYAAPGFKLSCTNNTWRTASSPRYASGQFWVSGVQKTLVTPAFP